MSTMSCGAKSRARVPHGARVATSHDPVGGQVETRRFPPNPEHLHGRASRHSSGQVSKFPIGWTCGVQSE
jgi:hypothetical protein